MPDMARLVEASMRLRSEAPGAWASFILAMTEYSGSITTEMVRCTPDMLARAQGMALQANEIASILADAPNLHEKFMARKFGKQ